MTEDRRDLFNNWSNRYDAAVFSREGFPFTGYADVLRTMVELAHPREGMSVLDLGVGTGNVAQAFAREGCSVTGVDFSEKMTRYAQEKVPALRVIHADVTVPPPDIQGLRFERIVSGYTFHEFDTPAKIDALRAYAQHHLHPEGMIIIGDISFETKEKQREARQQWQAQWDEDEYYWNSDEMEPLIAGVGFAMEYRQVSEFGGVYLFKQVEG